MPASFTAVQNEASVETHINEDNNMASISIPASVPISVSEKVYRTPTSSVPAVSHSESVIDIDFMQTQDIMSCSLHKILIPYIS